MADIVSALLVIVLFLKILHVLKVHEDSQSEQ
jgi:hypothetical protein